MGKGMIKCGECGNWVQDDHGVCVSCGNQVWTIIEGPHIHYWYPAMELPNLRWGGDTVDGSDWRSKDIQILEQRLVCNCGAEKWEKV